MSEQRDSAHEKLLYFKRISSTRYKRLLYRRFVMCAIFSVFCYFLSTAEIANDNFYSYNFYGHVALVVLSVVFVGFAIFVPTGLILDSEKHIVVVEKAFGLLKRQYHFTAITLSEGGQKQPSGGDPELYMILSVPPIRKTVHAGKGKRARLKLELERILGNDFPLSYYESDAS